MENPRRMAGQYNSYRSAAQNTAKKDDDDSIVPRNGYYFEHDDRDVWRPRRGGRAGFNRPRPRPADSSFWGHDADNGKRRANRPEGKDEGFRPYRMYEEGRGGRQRRSNQRDGEYGHKSVDMEDAKADDEGLDAGSGREKRLRSKIEVPGAKKLRSKIEAPEPPQTDDAENTRDMFSKRGRREYNEDVSFQRKAYREPWQDDRSQRPKGAPHDDKWGRSEGWSSFGRGSGGGREFRRRPPSPDVWKHDKFEEINAAEPAVEGTRDDNTDQPHQGAGRGGEGAREQPELNGRQGDTNMEGAESGDEGHELAAILQAEGGNDDDGEAKVQEQDETQVA